jgi:DNA polymerase sigma
MKDGFWMVRRLSLIALGILASLLLISQWLWGNHLWAIVFGVLTSVVLIAEIISYLRFKKTISTIFGEFLVQHRAKGYVSLALFLMAMCSLVIHLGSYEKTEEEKK